MKALMYLNKYFLKYKWLMLFGILTVGISNIISIYPAQIFRDAIDTVIESLRVVKAFEGTPLAERFTTLLVKSFLFFGLSVLVLALVKGVFTFLMRQTIIVMSRRIEFDLKNEIFNKYQALDISFYKQNKVGDIMNRISEDVSAIRMYIGPAIMYTVNLIVLFVVVIYTMFSINAELSWYTLAPLPVMSVLIYYVSDLMNKKSMIKQAQLSRIFSHAQERFSGIRVVKAYNQVNESEKEFQKECDDFLDKSMDLVKVNSLFHPIIILLPALSTLITIYIGGLNVIDGEITYGNIAEFVIYINMLTWPMASLGWVTSLVQRAAASQERVNEFLKIKPSIDYSGKKDVPLKGKITFKNVSYTYPESGIKALDNVSFEINQGETLGVIGRTGSGKSTIALLLLRVIDPDEGEILIDDVPLADLDIQKFRSKVGYVPQEVFLFSDTIKNNIAFGDVIRESSQSEIEEAAKMASVHKNIMGFTNQYETRVGERGVTLSGGQKQRVSIARALLKKPDVLLLDDCLSAVDTETEDEILGHLTQLMKGKSGVVIAHRVSSIKNAAHIIVLDDGQVVEHGNHQKLMDQGGLYFDFYQKQLVSET